MISEKTKLEKSILLTCDYCAEKFLRYYPHVSPKQNFCSRKCVKLAQTNKKIVNCVSCGAELERVKYQLDNNRVFYCDQKCRVINIKSKIPKHLLRRERSVLISFYGSYLVNADFRKICALRQFSKRKLSKSILNHVLEGRTYEAYI